jgi:uncharacterized protein involved in response to NO
MKFAALSLRLFGQGLIRVSGSDPVKVIACVFALAAFAVAIIAGLSAGNSAARVLGSALAAMFICHIMGLVIGTIGHRVVTDHLSSIPIEAEETKASGAGGAPATRTS